VRILLITETPPFPLDSGGRIKTFHTLGMLSRQHEVHCHALTRGPVDAVPAEVRALVASMTLHRVPSGAAWEAGALLRAVGRSLPYTVTRHDAPYASAAILHAARERAPDVVYADHLSMMAYARRIGRPGHLHLCMR
jgi:hypothetical protein